MEKSLNEKQYIGVVPLAGERYDNSFKVFDVGGDSMSPTLNPGAMFLAKEVPERLWGSLTGVVVVICDRKILVRRIATNLFNENGTITLIADNNVFPSIVLNMDKITAMFKAIRIIHQYIE
ncbi:MAG: hypothetical protein K2M11_01305 [Paramuribaculum sp.]|nr:hypothetical protein [Paramuribaculum sp.]